MLFELPESKEGKKGLESIKVSSLNDAGWKEKDLENLLTNNITRLVREEYLMPISQERPMQEEPDILALDKDGILHIFELKRAKSEPKHLLQVMRYGQRFGVYDYEQLNKKYQNFEKGSEKDLQEAHKEYFGLEEKLPKKEFNKNQKFIVVTNGLDRETLRSIIHWREKGLPIDPLTYNIYNVGNHFLLDFNPYGGQEDEYSIAETRNHIVNTNVTHRPEAYKDMLAQNKASAYGSRVTAVDSIKKGDRVFLYHTGVGICAVGRAKANVKSTSDNDEHYVKCTFRKNIDPVKNSNNTLSAQEINEALGTRWSFRNTRFSTISDEEADKIEKMFLTKSE